MENKTDNTYPATASQIEQARVKYQYDDVMVKDDAVTYKAKGAGRWVSAWVWLAE